MVLLVESKLNWNWNCLGELFAQEGRKMVLPIQQPAPYPLGSWKHAARISVLVLCSVALLVLMVCSPQPVALKSVRPCSEFPALGLGFLVASRFCVRVVARCVFVPVHAIDWPRL